MGRGSLILTALLLLFFIVPADLLAQCSICTRTAAQLGERPAKALNAGIIYLGLTPFVIIGYIGYRWWQNNKIED
ncbi:hypothetical protein A4H97_01975 [Niastella yeongjuensis]|uniref:Uncharacterized protein n=1 Tax=Niastella yeongjuensis TaxID=354355 RepID=A0A1V9EWW8_9BACT|nr:hypothetical protein [Niastella yeongjuensis]OQP50631.1 hypothetical protein A4H97_01975 [Niastella yeongjuensis]SEN25258.1 hypothetical protein SAMN05660816_00550 [Niastella yeongjuensis]